MKLSIIAVTLPRSTSDEGAIIKDLLASGCVDRVHLRKPACSTEDLQRLIEEIPSQFHSRLSLHDSHSVASMYGCGIHLNSRNPVAPENYNGVLSRSCHSIEELALPCREDYRFLSPIYPSISKPGYAPTRSLASLKGKIGNKTIALGGITPDKFRELYEHGFSGAAMSGYIWEAVAANRLQQLIKEIECYNS